ncbi:glycerol-3-phosphate dehydrogenase/oxidase [Pontibacter ruber]|uniref:FAD-dependent oxidoreductase n=1 Tax=Pontibacter ruber TaxID=1343895 RepID=A0ABW5CXK0_9BACT|nr:glycerol-3-phosphate dehydrogenase/oxidase [Pontibacter ruber]
MNRTKLLEQLHDPHISWDIIVIGGGATGLGVAMDAAIRGYRTLLLEQADFAKGTSSRSTKLIHGGVRYLAQGKVALVLEALRERGLLLKNAAHVVRRQAFVIPYYNWWDGPFYTIGLRLYDVLAGKLSLGASRRISKEKTIEALPVIETKGLKGGIVYYDAQFDDTRLAVYLAQTAVDNGACVLNYMQVVGLLKDDTGRVSGVQARETENDSTYLLKAKTVVNATGVFVDAILRMENPQAEPLVRPSQGVHVVLDSSFLPGDNALLIPKTADGRVLFAVPWHNKVLVGTTDTLRRKVELEPQALEEEINFILDTAGQYLTRKPTRKDVCSVFAGLRPLAAQQGKRQSTKEISRNFKVMVTASGLVTITGGKWTIFRLMAERTVDAAIKAGKLLPKPCTTQSHPIHGNKPFVHCNSHLALYGADMPAIQQLMQQEPELAQKLHPDFPYTKAEVVWAARKEMARTVEDVLARRVRLLFLDARAALAAAPEVARLLSLELQKDETWREQQIAGFTALARHYIL